MIDLQFVLVVLFFLGASIYLFRLLRKNFSGKSCASGCGTCEIPELKK